MTMDATMLAAATTTSLSLPSTLTLVGRSRAGNGTCFYIPELRWMLDAGALVTMSHPQHLFVTHTHSDHISQLAQLILNTTTTTSPLTIHVPESVMLLVQRHVDAYLALIECDDVDYRDHNRASLHYTLQPVALDQQFTILKGGTEYVIQPVECHHRITCYGYSIFQTKRRLLPEYAGLSSKEIGDFKKQGVVITESVQEPLLCFLGDTTHRVFDRYPDLPLQHTVMVVECSFLDDADIGRAEETKHMHWNKLRPVIEAHPTTMFVLIHFSLKYSNLRLREFFCEAQITLGLRNVHPMILQEQVEAEWIKARGNGIDDNLVPSCQCRRCKKVDPQPLCNIIISGA